MIRFKLTNNEGIVVSINDYWTNDDYTNMPKGLNNLNKTNLTIENALIDKENNSIKVEVVNNGAIIAPYVEMDLLENDESILPSYYSDSYFNLLPGEKRTIIIEVPNLNEIERVAVVVAKSLNSQAKFLLNDVN
jgi:mannosylglycoprotein endo-beta-mannosidase